jgi:hypothetical protein
MSKKIKLKLAKRPDGYWVTGMPECSDVGPYDNRPEAQEHREGLQRTFDNIDDWSFFTSEQQ